MVSRTRIPIAMYETGYTPSTPSGVVTPAAMTKSGSGEPIKKEIKQDYPCGSEPGHSFRSSPLNIYAIGRDSAVVLYIEGGCPNFTWESDNEWATFETAETSTRYNTITSSADEGEDTTVTVTDSNGLEVTISVPYNGSSTCCEDILIEFALQTDNVDLDDSHWPGEVVTFIDGGCPPFTWEVTGDGFSLDYEETNSRRNRLHGDNGASGPVVGVTDYCESSLCWSPDFDYISEQHTKIAASTDLTVEKGKVNITWEFVGDAEDWTIQTSPTEDLDTVLTPPYATSDETVIVKATDACGSEASKSFMLSCNPVYGGQSRLVLDNDYAPKLNDICQVSGILFAAVGSQTIYTFTVNLTTGAMELLNSSVFSVTTVYSPKVITITVGESSSIIAVAWGENTQGLVETYTITHATGAISAAIDSEQFFDGKVEFLDFCLMRENVYGIPHSRTTDDTAFLTAVGIDGAGQIGTDFEHDHLFTEQFHDSKLRSVSICKGASYPQDIAIAFSEYSTKKGIIETWDVSTGGIGAAYVGEVQISANACTNADIIPMSYDNDGYVLIWQDDGGGGHVEVYSQDDDNNISQDDTYDISTYCYHPTIVGMQEDCFLAFYGYSINYRFHTFLIDTFGDYEIRNMTYRTTTYGPYGTQGQVCKGADGVAAACCNFSSGTAFGIYSTTMFCNTYS